jgi:hypothetical protein
MTFSGGRGKNFRVTCTNWTFMPACVIHSNTLRIRVSLPNALSPGQYDETKSTDSMAAWFSGSGSVSIFPANKARQQGQNPMP